MIDPNEAPEGYEAVAAIDTCHGCAFLDDHDRCSRDDTGWDGTCFRSCRADGEPVIFIKREEAPAHAVMTPKQVRDALFMSVMDLHRLRDEFAKEAMAGSQGRAMTETQMTQAACIAYWQADAMLAAKFSTMTWGQK